MIGQAILPAISSESLCQLNFYRNVKTTSCSSTPVPLALYFNTGYAEQ